jgi:hypothetical protein
MRNISDNIYRENQNKILCPITFSENRGVYEVCGKVW